MKMNREHVEEIPIGHRLRPLVLALALGSLACESPDPDTGRMGSEASVPPQPTTTLEDLAEPSVVWEQDAPNRLCSKIIAVDGAGGVWTEQGCENGRPRLARVGTADRLKLQALRERVDTLPVVSMVAVDSCSETVRHRFSKRMGSVEQLAYACGSGAMYDDLAGLPEPYLAAAGAFLAVP